VLVDSPEAEMSKFVIALVAAATLALAACGSSKSSSSGNETTTSGGGTSASEFSSLVSKAKDASFKVTYKTSNGDTITVAQDGTGKQAITDGNNLFISTGSTAISCDGTTSSATCRDLGAAGKATAGAGVSLITGTASAIATLGSSSILNGQTSSETIAGRDATCVTVKASDLAGVFGSIARLLTSDATAEVCADKETGVLLKLSGGTGSSPTDLFVATEFGEPSDSDFQPPSTPQSLPTVPSFTIPKITLPSG
jgi:hypothetical protein